ncbi:GNAT family acetyltransferase [Calditrichota bacterium]
MINKKDFNIREYHSKDEKQVIELWYTCDLIVPWNNPKLDIERKLKVNPELFLIGELNDKVIASVMGGYEGHRGWINYLAVLPEYRGNGFAREIMKVVEQKLKNIGCPKINLQIRSSNKEVIKFYERIGYFDDHMTSMGKILSKDPSYKMF